jgi:hypothetical protein
MQPAVSASGRVTRAELDTTQEVLKVNGILNTTFSPGDVFDDSFTGS